MPITHTTEKRNTHQHKKGTLHTCAGHRGRPSCCGCTRVSSARFRTVSTVTIITHHSSGCSGGSRSRPCLLVTVGHGQGTTRRSCHINQINTYTAESIHKHLPVHELAKKGEAVVGVTEPEKPALQAQPLSTSVPSEFVGQATAKA